MKPFLALTLAALAASSAALAGPSMLARSTVVHLEDSATDTLQNFLAAVPTAVSHRGGNTYQGLLTTDQIQRKANGYLLRDWAKYLQSATIEKKLVLVGAVSAETVAALKAGLGEVTVQRVDGATPVELSRELALATFATADMAVLVPYVAHPKDADLASMASAAALAASKGAPLLFVKPDGITEATLTALNTLHVRSVQVVDITHQLAPTALGALAAHHVDLGAQFTDTKTLVAALHGEGLPLTICVAQNGAQCAPAAIAAARYGATVQIVTPAVVALAVSARAQADRAPKSRRKLTKVTRLPREESAMVALANGFYSWLGEIGADDPAHLENVLTFADGLHTDALPMTLERAISGDPRHQADHGAIPSRLPGPPADNIAFINRTTLYRALIHQSPRFDRTSLLMMANEVENVGPECELHYVDWEGKDHKANEFYGCHEGGFDDPGVYESLKAGNYKVGFHNGRNPGDGVDQINHEPNYGFWKELKDGSSFLYTACHGSETGIYPLANDKGVCEDVPFGTPYWPSPPGRTNNMGDTYAFTDVDADYDNLNSILTVFNACLTGAGAMGRTILDHGGAGSIASYISVSFDGGGLWGCYLVNELTKPGVTVGQALAYATARTSECFARAQEEGDHSLRFVHVGDACMEMVKPTWTPPAPVADPRR